MRLDPAEMWSAVAVIVLFLVVLFLMYRRDKWLDHQKYLTLILFFVMINRITTNLEVYFWPEVLNFIEHLSFLVAVGIGAYWAWRKR